MKKNFLLTLVILCTSFVSKGQDSINQKEIIKLMNDYSEICCKWDPVYAGDKFVGYVKTIQIIPKDTSDFFSIFFYSNTVKEKNDKKIEVVYGEINDEPIAFIVEVDNQYTVKTQLISPIPLLEAEMTRLLQTTKPGSKKRK